MISNTGKSLQAFKKALLEIDLGRKHLQSIPLHHGGFSGTNVSDLQIYSDNANNHLESVPNTLVNALINIFRALTPITAVTPR